MDRSNLLMLALVLASGVHAAEPMTFTASTGTSLLERAVVMGPPRSFIFSDEKGALITISTVTGKVTLRPGVKSGAAARHFWAAVEQAWPWVLAVKCPHCGVLVKPEVK